MTGYQNKVIHLASDKQKDEVQLVVNLFQSVLDGFIRGEMKKEEAEPAKVRRSPQFFSVSLSNLKLTGCLVFQPAKARKKRRSKDKSVSSQHGKLSLANCIFSLFFVHIKMSNPEFPLLDREPPGSQLHQLSGQHHAVV